MIIHRKDAKFLSKTNLFFALFALLRCNPSFGIMCDRERINETRKLISQEGLPA
jgi:hypothetical protein